MRQVVKLLRVIGKASLTEFYESALSYRFSQREEMPSLTEFLSLTLGETAKESQSFDVNSDKFLEEQALKRLNERRQSAK